MKPKLRTSAGVQCENCHGPAGQHILNPFDPLLAPKVEMSSKVCGGCHTDAHHPTYDEWELSQHAKALDTIKNHPFGRDSCLECHSQDYRYAHENDLTPLPTKLTAQLTIECSTCHSAHGASNEVAQLRLPIGLLCGECHTAEEVALGDNPHHPQWEVLQGIGTFREDGSSLTNTSSFHTLLASDGGSACAKCHVVQHQVDHPDEGNPNVTGHTFNPYDDSITEHQPEKYDGCLPCHDALTAKYLHIGISAYVTNRLSQLAPYFDPSSSSYIDPDSLSPNDQPRLSVAKFNYQYLEADSSKGVHNPEFYRESIAVAEYMVKSLTLPSK